MVFNSLFLFKYLMVHNCSTLHLFSLNANLFLNSSKKTLKESALALNVVASWMLKHFQEGMDFPRDYVHTAPWHWTIARVEYVVEYIATESTIPFCEPLLLARLRTASYQNLPSVLWTTSSCHISDSKLSESTIPYYEPLLLATFRTASYQNLLYRTMNNFLLPRYGQQAIRIYYPVLWTTSSCHVMDSKLAEPTIPYYEPLLPQCGQQAILFCVTPNWRVMCPVSSSH
jgi:hypothetical protein